MKKLTPEFETLANSIADRWFGRIYVGLLLMALSGFLNLYYLAR